MVLPALACWLVGKVLAFAFACENTFFGKRLFEVAVLMLLIVVAMANVRGMYWSIFPQGEGFFTANRVSANILFIGLVFVATAANGRKARTFAGQSE